MASTASPCGDPIASETLLDYWLGSLDDSAEGAVEEHLFSCDACGDRLRAIGSLLEAVRGLAMSGSLRVAVDEGFERQARDKGLQVRTYAPAHGESIQCTVAADDDLLMARLTADLSGASRIDISFAGPAGNEWQRMIDVPFDARIGQVIYQESVSYAKGAGSNTLVARLLAVDGDVERLLGEYTFHHTRTIPGPPSW